MPEETNVSNAQVVESNAIGSPPAARLTIEPNAAIRVGVPAAATDSPTLSVTIDDPQDGGVINIGYTGLITYASGKASFDASISNPDVSVSINNGPGVSANLQDRYWVYQLILPGVGSATISAKATGTFTDSQGNQRPVASTSTITVTITADITPIPLTITSPQADAQIADDPNGVKINVAGTVTDRFRLASVWTKSGLDQVDAQFSPGSSGNWSWSATVALDTRTRGGARTLSVGVSDEASRYGAATVTVYLETPFSALDQSDSLSPLTYLRDLVLFATEQIIDSTSPKTYLESTDPRYAFYQPFDRLTTDEQLHQVRLCVEVLRSWLAPVAYWKFDENSGTTAGDSSGNGLSGTLNGPATWVAGRSGSAIAFDGSSAYVQIGDKPQLRVTTALSIAAWIYPTGAGTPNSGGAIVSKEDQYVIARYPDGTIRWAFADLRTTVVWNWINTQFIAPLNQWTHIVIRYFNGAVNTYANGKLEHSYFGTGPISSIGPSNHNFRIGGAELWGVLATTPLYFQGSIDEVEVFDRVLSEEEIVSLYQGVAVPDLAAAAAAYRLSVYEALLLKLGTSYQEMRLARAADDATRNSLAARLGIDLEASRPDKLDKLILKPGDITEARLEEIFGLIDTTRNPLSAPSLTDPELLSWQKAHLRSIWLKQDYPTDSNPNFPLPIIDPDLFVEDDFAPAAGSSSNPALDLWKARKAWLDGQLQDLVNDIQTGENDQVRLARLVGLKLNPVTMNDLRNWNTIYTQGAKIDDKLNPVPLSFSAFSYLIRLYNLAAGQPLLDDEWAAAYSILVQVQKARQFISWRAKEANPPGNSGPITIDPAYFKANSDLIMLPEWRATNQARSRWKNILTSRTFQISTLEQALQNAIESAEESTLPKLRDALLAAIKLPSAVTSLFSTGVVAGDLILPDNAIDPHWVITATPSGGGNFSAYATTNVNGFPVGNPWLANSETSRWISPQADEHVGDAPGSYTYKTTFDLTGFELSSVQVGLNVAVDNDLTDVKLNGKSVGLNASGFSGFTPLAINGGYVSGVNTLEFIVNNTGTTPNPSGLRVEFKSNGVAQANSDWVAERLLIDVETSGAIKTTRVSQAIETMQGILFSVRTRRFATLSTLGNLGSLGNIAYWRIAIADTDFDVEWSWMGTYATWRAAMEVFLYPENALSPSYLQAPSDFFQAVLADLRLNQPLIEDLADPPAAPGKGLLSKLYNHFSPPNDSQTQNWNTGVTGIKNLILGSDQDLGNLRDNIQPSLYKAYHDSTPANTDALRYWREVFYFVPVQIALQLKSAGRFEDAVSCLRAVYAYDLPDKRKVFLGLTLEEVIAPAYLRQDWLRQLEVHEVIALTRPNAYTRFTLMTLVRCFLDFADSEFTKDTAESLSQARELYVNALELLALPEMQPENNGFQPNPVPEALGAHALNNLVKLRSGLNIAGAERSVPFVSAGAGDQLGLQPRSAARPTQYRYATLIERAKQLVQLAQQVESPYLAALQQEDAESYNLLKANQDFELANANLDLQALKVTEANDGVSLATDQTARAQTQFDTYDGWINAGPLQSENDMIQNYKKANEARNWVAGLNATITATHMFTVAGSGGILGTGLAAAGFGFASAGAAAAVAEAAAQSAANNAESRAQIDSANASFERRTQEWQLQKSLAKQDLTIGQDQIQLAKDRVTIAGQEQKIATIQNAHDKAIIDFLSNKFMNVELYEWMSGVLGAAYHYFLQQATATALLAEKQLSFERQEANLGVIKADYWQSSSQSGSTQSSTGAQGGPTDTRGLTGSARLLEDITQLDQYAFLTDTRKLQLTKTISLARSFPFEFQQFRETGVLPFATPMSIFDQDFPGHYLRLIKRIRVSVIALIPPNQGIKASLAATGISRVTLCGDVFQTVPIQGSSEIVTLSSPMNATGLFELDAQPELLLPFEGMGVDTSWEFRMPKAANLFDYATIADILLTMDYTALDSPDYRQQITRQLDRNIGLDRAFSFRQEFADQWYQLNNPDQSNPPFNVQFSTKATDFPPNIDNLAIQNVLLHFVSDDEQPFEVSNVSLTVGKLGGSARSIDRTISITRGNASAWVPMVGQSPIGNWKLVLPDTQDSAEGPGTRTLFGSGAIQDILFVITYRGQTPAWPV